MFRRIKSNLLLRNDFEIGICEPDEKPTSPSSTKSFSRHVLDDNDYWREAVTAAFRLIDRRGDGAVEAADVLWAVGEYDLVRRVLGDSEGPQQAAEVAEFLKREFDGPIDEATWVSKFCVEGPKNQHLPVPQRFDSRAYAQTTAYVLDLDGTCYRPGALIPGAAEFYEVLRSQQIPHVFLSNTGSKSLRGTQLKLMTPPYKIADDPVPMDRIMTAADAQAHYMCRHVPEGAHILVVSGGGDFWRHILRDRDPERYDTWDIRTSLTDEEAMSWACEAAANYRGACDSDKKPIAPKVVVAFFLDGDVASSTEAEGGWRYDLIKHCAFLLSHYASFIYTADDPFNPSSHDRFVGDVFPLPGPGMFASMLKPIMPPGAERDGRWACCGKGGNVGHDYMVNKAIDMLKAQGHDGARSKILLVGDRYATDIRAGNRAGLKTCLVESGCNRVDERCFFPCDVPTYWAESIADLAELATRGSFASLSSSSSSIDKADKAPPVSADVRQCSARAAHRRGSLPQAMPPVRSPSSERELEALPARDVLRAWRLRVARNGIGRSSAFADVRDLLQLYFAKSIARKTDVPAFTFADLNRALGIIGINNVPASQLVTLVRATPGDPTVIDVDDDGIKGALTLRSTQFAFILETLVADIESRAGRGMFARRSSSLLDDCITDEKERLYPQERDLC